MRGEHGREGAGCDGGTSALTGHIRGRCSRAGCGDRRCCSSMLRELASFGWDHPTQLLFIAAASSVMIMLPAAADCWELFFARFSRKSHVPDVPGVRLFFCWLHTR